MRKIKDNLSPFEMIFSNRLFLVLWILGCIVLGGRFIYSSFGTKQAFSAKKQAEDRLKVEEQRGIDLLQKLDKADSPLEEEKRIRDELNMQKPGEIILQFPSPTPQQ